MTNRIWMVRAIALLLSVGHVYAQDASEEFQSAVEFFVEAWGTGQRAEIVASTLSNQIAGVTRSGIFSLIADIPASSRLAPLDSPTESDVMGILGDLEVAGAVGLLPRSRLLYYEVTSQDPQDQVDWAGFDLLLQFPELDAFFSHPSIEQRRVTIGLLQAEQDGGGGQPVAILWAREEGEGWKSWGVAPIPAQ